MIGHSTRTFTAVSVIVVVLLLGDMHLGSIAKKHYLNGLSEFNIDIFKRSLEKLLEETITVLRERRKLRNLEKLHVFMLGDIVDGEGIFQGHAHEVDVTVIDQILEGSTLLAQFLSSLTKEVPEIIVNCVSGNHGRISHDAPTEDNWERLLYELIKRNLEKHKTITMNTGKEFFRIVEIYDHKFMLVHGHELRTLTSAGLERLVSRYTQITRAGFDYLCMGHHHRHVQYEFNHVEAIVNPPFVHTSHYGLAKLALQSKPGQLIMGVSPDHGVRWKDRLPVWDSKI